MSFSYFSRWWASLAALMLLCACWISSTAALTATDPDATSAEKTNEAVQVFMCADSGEYSGAHELGILQNSMENAEVLQLAHCQSAQLGYIRHADGHAIRSLTVTTGIGYISATLCTTSVLRFRLQRNLHYKSIVYIGTSGFSPMVGGWDPTNTTAYASFTEKEREAMVNGEAEVSEAPPALFKTLAEVQEAEVQALQRRRGAVEAGVPYHLPYPSQLNFEHAETGEQVEYDGCAPRRTGSATSHTAASPAAATEATKPLAVGSVCVTSSAFFMESGSCTERTRHTQCSRPHCSGFQNSLSSESKMYFTKDDFAKAIEAASHDKVWPEIPPLVQDGLKRFWAANEAVEPADRAAPTSPSFVTCAESTVNAINVGAERDFLCREYTAYTLNTMRRQTAGPRRDADPAAAPLTVNDVVCVQAMEAIGFLRSMAADAAASATIPVAVLRTASNYDMYPLRKHYVPSAVWKAAVASKAVPVSSAVAQAIEAAESDVVAYTWEQNFDFMSPEEYEKFVMASFHYSVKTVTFVVSNYFFGGRTFE